LFNLNLRLQAPVFNIKVRKNYLLNPNFSTVTLGSLANLNYYSYQIGNNMSAFLQLVEGSHSFCSSIFKFENAHFLIGSSGFMRIDGNKMMSLVTKMVEINHLFKRKLEYSVFQSASNSVAINEFGIIPGIHAIKAKYAIGQKVKSTSERDFYYLVGCDDNIDNFGFNQTSTIIYQGHHGERLAKLADIVLPTVAFAEKNSLYINAYGLVQLARFVIFPPMRARAD